MSEQRAQVFSIFGFLGSGKTTLIRNIFTWDLDLGGTVVVVNEFGKVGIDGAILGNGTVPVVELSNGCICCSMQTELTNSLKEIIEMFSPQRILIEATGVADPGDVLALLDGLQKEGLIDVSKVICVVDAEFWEAREMLGPLFFNQIAAADLVVFNKTDLLNAEQVPLFLSQFHTDFPDCRVIPALFCQVDPFTFWSEEQLKKDVRDLSSFFSPLHVHHADDMGFATFSFESEFCFREECFQSFLDKLPFEVFRAKGFVRFPGQTRLLNFVGGKANWENVHENRSTGLTFVGRNIDAQMYVKQMETCLQK